MKRYLKLGLTVMIILATMIFFYMRSEADFLEKLKVKITHLSGERSAIDELDIHGAVEARPDNYYHFDASWLNFIIENKQAGPKVKSDL